MSTHPHFYLPTMGRMQVTFHCDEGYVGRSNVKGDDGAVRLLRRLAPTAIYLWAAEDRPGAFQEDHRELQVPVAGVLARLKPGMPYRCACGECAS